MSKAKCFSSHPIQLPQSRRVTARTEAQKGFSSQPEQGTNSYVAMSNPDDSSSWV
ncbi:MAG: hypothetical protein WCE25_06145 [Nitrososphaeraceae archaeon]